MMKLSVKAMTLALGLFWGGGFLVVALVNLAAPNYGVAVLELCSSVYPGYHANQTLASVVVGTIYAIFDGGISGCIFAWLYNRLSA